MTPESTATQEIRPHGSGPKSLGRAARTSATLCGTNFPPHTLACPRSIGSAVRDLAGAILANPDDLNLLGGAILDDLPRDEAGNLDTAAVQAAIDTLATARPILTISDAVRAALRSGPSPTGQKTRLPIPSSSLFYVMRLATSGPVGGAG